VLGAPIELVALRAAGYGRTVQASLDATRDEPVPDGTPAPATGRRTVRLGRGPDGGRDVDVYGGANLRPGHALRGPALVDGTDTTIWIPDGFRAELDPYGTLVMEVAP
jgi:N-methylhydantoinase A